MFKKTSVLLIVGVLILIFAGCNKLVENATKKAIEKGAGVSVDKDNNSIKVKTKEGEAELQTSENKLPDGFPKDFPVYENAKVKSSLKTSTEKDGTNYAVSWESSDSSSDILPFYKKELPKAGYKLTSTVEANDGGSFTFEEGMVIVNNEKDKSIITLSLTVK